VTQARTPGAVDVPWSQTLSLRIQDVDYRGHLSAAACLALYNDTRVAWLAEAWNTDVPVYTVVYQELRVIRSVLMHDGPLTLSIVPVRLGMSSFDVEESLFTASGDCRSRSRAELVACDIESSRPRALTVGERSALEAQLQTATWDEHEAGTDDQP
jgi:acyl-CoA thioesterase FadM